jgi:hypothetical protein
LATNCSFCKKQQKDTEFIKRSPGLVAKLFQPQIEMLSGFLIVAERQSASKNDSDMISRDRVRMTIESHNSEGFFGS